MAQRKVSILHKAAEEVAYVAYFIESKGLPKTAKKFVDESFSFFDKLGDPRIKHKPCTQVAVHWFQSILPVISMFKVRSDSPYQLLHY